MTAPVLDAQPVIDAVRAAIAAHGVAVDIGRKPTVGAGLPWLVLWPDPGSVTNQSMRSRDGFSLVVSMQGYGLSPASALWAIRRARTGVLGMAHESVGGRTVGVPSLLESPPPLSRDDDADPPIFMQYDEARFRLT